MMEKKMKCFIETFLVSDDDGERFGCEDGCSLFGKVLSSSSFKTILPHVYSGKCCILLEDEVNV